MNAIIIKIFVFGLFLNWIPKIVAQSSCCKTIKANLERKWIAYKNICSADDACHALRFKGYDKSEYAISKDDRVSSIAAITVCFWVKSSQTADSSHFISYAVPEDDNQFIMFSSSSQLKLRVMYGDGSSPAAHTSKNHNIKIDEGKWHHVCATWKSQGGNYEIYKDGNSAGKGILTGTSGKTLTPGGMWVLGQDQDSVGGGFKANQSVQGEMADVNVWDKVLSPKEILKLSVSCQSTREGNVKSWNDFKSGVKGNVKSVNPTCCSMFGI